MTKAASNSSYRYMTVLIQMLAVVSLPVESKRRGGTRSPDAFAQAAGHDHPVDLVDFFDFDTDDAARRLAGGDGGVSPLDIVLAEEAGGLKVLAPDAIGAQIDCRARDQFIAGEDFHMRYATLKLFWAAAAVADQSPEAMARPIRITAGPSGKSTTPCATAPSVPE